MSDKLFQQAVRDWLEDGSDRTPRPAIDAVLLAVKTTPQERDFRIPRRFNQMPTYMRLAAGIAIVAIVGVGALALFGKGPNVGGPGPVSTSSPPPSPSAAPTAVPTVPSGALRPGTYVAHPLPAPHASLSVTFTVPSVWDVVGMDGAAGGLGMSLLPERDLDTNEAQGAIAIQFIEITSLNGDVCRWAGDADDVAVGTSVDDLVAALVSQTAFEVADPVAVTIGGFTGKRVDIVAPTKPFSGHDSDAPGCNEDVLRLWNTTHFGEEGVYLQGPANRWQANILDVAGTRLVVVVQDFPGTLPADRAELDGIVDSMIIKP